MKQKYSEKTKQEAGKLILDHFQALNYGLMEVTGIEPKDYEKIISSIKDRDILLLEKLGLN